MGLLEQVPLFAGIGADAIERLEARLARQRFVAGEVILRAGSESSALYGVIAGAVRVARRLGPGHTVVTILCDSGERYLL